MGRSATARGGLVLAGAGDRNRTLFPRPNRARPGVPRLARPRAVNVRLVLSTAAALALAIALGACGSSSASTSTRPSPSSSPRPSPSATLLGCAWYSPTGSDGQVVNVTATGPACSTSALVGWLAQQTRRTWTTEPMIPGSFGELLAVERKAGSSVWVYFTGPEPSA